MRRSTVLPLVLPAMALAWPTTTLAHGGGLDGYGCHQDHKHGGYHCHRGLLAGTAFASRAHMLDSLSVERSKAAPVELAPVAPAAPPLPAAADYAKIKDPKARAS